jgi:acyl-CoA reductase-like NAD-dependent aldehyde dehydrogenase
MLALWSTLCCVDSEPATRPLVGKGANVDDQLTLFELSATDVPPVWESLSAEERALVMSVVARLMARAIADLADHIAHRENGHD